MHRTWTAALLLALAAVPAGAVNVELLSRVPPRRASETASGSSRPLAISADGRYTVVASEAVNLVPGMAAAPLGTYFYLHDRVAGTFTRIGPGAVSPGNLGVETPRASISADGRFVAFESWAADQVDGVEDSNQAIDLFLWDRVTGETELVSRSDADPNRTANAGSYFPALSADGGSVAFYSAAGDLVDGLEPTAGAFQVFLWERATGTVLPVSRSAKTPGRYGDATSSDPSISADGRFVAFLSLATDLTAGQSDANGVLDAFLWDRATQRTVLVSRAATNPDAAGNRETPRALISADGRFVALLSLATDFLPGPRGGGANVFLWERATGSMSLVSHGSNPANPALLGRTSLAAVSANGSYVLFTSDARNLVPDPGRKPIPTHVFLWSRASGRNQLVTRGANADSVATGLSADGAWIIFESSATNLVSGITDANLGLTDVFLANARSGRITLLSESGEDPGQTAQGSSSFSRISADGRWTAFASTAPDLEAGVKDLNLQPDAVLADRQGERTIVSVHPQGLASATPQGETRVQSIDASGRFVVFVSTADAGQLVAGVEDANGSEPDVFLYDRQLRTLTLVTRSAVDPHATADQRSPEARMSADGRWVAFTSEAGDLIPGQVNIAGGGDVYLWDRTTGQTIRASRSAASPTTGGDHPSFNPQISADGSVVAFESAASNLVPGQTEAFLDRDVFLFDRTTGTVTLVSRAAGSASAVGERGSVLPSVSADGRFVAFVSTASNLVTGAADPTITFDAFLFDRTAGTTVLVSRTTAPALTAAGSVSFARVSADGRFVLFESEATGLVPGQDDLPATPDLFLFDRVAGTTALVTHAAGSPSAATGGSLGPGRSGLSADGRFAVFASTAGNHVPGQVEERLSADVFVFDRQTGGIELISRVPGSVATAGGGDATEPVIDASGRRVAFVSNRTDLIPGLHGPQGVFNLFVHDRTTGATTLVSHAFGDPARLSDGNVFESFLDADGSVTAFTSAAPDLVPRDFNRNIGLLPDAFAAEIP